MASKPYASDLTDEQGSLVEPYVPSAKPGGRPREADARAVVNGSIPCLNRTGCSWRRRPPPHDLPPPWGTVHYYYCRRFRIDGVWAVIRDKLREDVRVAAGKEPTPSAAVIDSPGGGPALPRR